MYYNCNRSYSSKEHTGRFSNNSRKIGNTCPSRTISIVNNDDHVGVDYWKTHLGHENLAKYVPIDKKLHQRYV